MRDPGCGIRGSGAVMNASLLHRWALGILALALGAGVATLPVLADNRDSGSWGDHLVADNGKPQQRYLRELTPDQRARLRRQAERFRALPDPDKRRLCDRFFDERGYLPPACRALRDD